MTNVTSLKKVLWRDGDVVSENHFYALEEWIEQTVGLSVQQIGISGLFRNPIFQSNYNDINNIFIKHIEGTQYRVDIEHFQGINPFGRLISIGERRTFEFNFRPAQRSPDGNYLLYVIPVAPGPAGGGKQTAELETGTVLYDAAYELSTSNDQNTGIACCRLRLEDSQIAVDPAFIPFCISMDGSMMSLAAHENIMQKFNLLSSMLDGYMSTLKPVPELALIWTLTGNVLRSIGAARPVIEQPRTSSYMYFTALQQFFNALGVELKILYVGWSQESLRQKASEVMAALSRPVSSTAGQQFDLATAFAQAGKVLETVVNFLSYLPAGPVAEKTLPVSKVEVFKEAAGNKLLVHLSGEVQLNKGKSRLVVSLREFSKSDPVGGNVRVGIGNAIFAQLFDLKNLLKKVPGESFSYTIECPPDVVTKDKTAHLTIYLPPPLGEGITDIKSHLNIIVRD